MSFSKQIKQHTDNYRKRLNFVAKDAAQRVINDAQRTQAKGGRLPLDTGFLRASGQAAIGSMPSGPANATSGVTYSLGQQAAGQPVSAVLIRWAPASEALYFGWTAVYARPMEYRYGYLRGATERWEEFVRRAANAATRNEL